jgi:hypothetical protein
MYKYTKYNLSFFSSLIDSGGKKWEIDLVNKFSHFLFAKHSSALRLSINNSSDSVKFP